jgi:hypothetical protein
MTSNRRNFLKQTLIGSGIIATGFAGNASVIESISETVTSGKQPAQSFNMCGYAAPKLDKVRIGFVGLGSRGPGAVNRMSHIEGVEIVALCDQYEDGLKKCRKSWKKADYQGQNRTQETRKYGKPCAKIRIST